MYAWITSRRLKRGTLEEFKKAWANPVPPKGYITSYLLISREDENEVMGISFWESKEARDATKELNEKRLARMMPFVEKVNWAKQFDAFSDEQLRPMIKHSK